MKDLDMILHEPIESSLLKLNATILFWKRYGDLTESEIFEVREYSLEGKQATIEEVLNYLNIYRREI